MNRKRFISSIGGLALPILSWSGQSLAFSVQPKTLRTELSPSTIIATGPSASTVVYKQLDLPVTGPNGSVNVPVACWFPLEENLVSENAKAAVYNHRISVRRIGQLLAGWDFIPEFVSKKYSMMPSSSLDPQAQRQVVDGKDLPLPSQEVPIVLLAHGYLGSRFDLMHLAEALASEGFVCLAAEYPESLAASYDRILGLDRRSINDILLDTMSAAWNLKGSSYGIVGHSLGCGTVQQTGDETWARVSIAGFPRNRDGSPISGNGLFVASMNDGAVSLKRFGGIGIVQECNYELVDESTILKRPEKLQKLPKRAAVVFDRPDAPNHISFLSEGVNDAMIEFLSPLLPVARAFDIPVLDFDRYQVSRDSRATAEVVHPIVMQYLKQEMLS